MKKNILLFVFIIICMTIYSKEAKNILILELENAVVEEPHLGKTISQLIYYKLTGAPYISTTILRKEDISFFNPDADVTNINDIVKISNNFFSEYVVTGTINSTNAFVKELSLQVVNIKSAKIVLTAKTEFMRSDDAYSFIDQFLNNLINEVNTYSLFFSVSILQDLLFTQHNGEYSITGITGGDIAFSILLYNFLGLRVNCGIGGADGIAGYYLKGGPYIKINDQIHLYGDKGIMLIESGYSVESAAYNFYGIGANIFIRKSFATNIEVSSNFEPDATIVQVSLGYTLSLY